MASTTPGVSVALKDQPQIRRAHQAVGDTPADRLGPVPNAEALLGVAEVAAHRVGGQALALGDLQADVAAADIAQQAPFLRRQVAHVAHPPIAGWLQELLAEDRIEVGAAAGDQVHGGVTAAMSAGALGAEAIEALLLQALQPLAIGVVPQDRQHPPPLRRDRLQQGQGVLDLPVGQVVAEEEEEQVRPGVEATGRIGADRPDLLQNRPPGPAGAGGGGAGGAGGGRDPAEQGPQVRSGVLLAPF